MKTIAISGKGGTGKSTLAALIIRWLGENRGGSVLAVDADSNVNLNDILGVKIGYTVGAIREEMKQSVDNLPAGMTKQQFLEYKIQTSLVETRCFDLIAMGRPEGPGCYCYANNVLGAAIRRLAGGYPTVVIDNEAGLENLSRRIVQGVDHLLFVADPSARSLRTARRLHELAVEMQIDARAASVVVNRVLDDRSLDRARRIFENTPIEVVNSVPDSAALGERDAEGEPVWTLPRENPVYAAAADIFKSMISRRGST